MFLILKRFIKIINIFKVFRMIQDEIKSLKTLKHSKFPQTLDTQKSGLEKFHLFKYFKVRDYTVYLR